eukprot:s3840_g2.t1
MALLGRADRERQRWVELTTNGPIGPLPSWEYDQAMELQTRPVGGRYTAVKLRPEPPVDEAAIPPAPHPTPRPATSGGRIRPPVPAPPISRGRSAGALPAARAEARFVPCDLAVLLDELSPPPNCTLLQRASGEALLVLPWPVADHRGDAPRQLRVSTTERVLVQ